MRKLSTGLFLVLGVLCLTPYVSSSFALAMGIAFALILGSPLAKETKTLTPRLLALSIVGLGAGIDLHTVGRAGSHGLGYTVIGITLTMAVGLLLGRWMKVEKDTSLLVCSGTAICGGSAIAAVSSVIRPSQQTMSVALATVFVLNAISLMVFPPVGHALGLTEEQFGLWSALAIHDTSSVVGATLQYGSTAVAIGTSVKLARAIWIIPMTLLIASFRRRSAGTGKAKKPWFILGFILAAALVTWVPTLREAGQVVNSAAKHLLVLTLFLIGSGLTRETLRKVGLKPLVLGTLLWGAVSVITLLAILSSWITL